MNKIKFCPLLRGECLKANCSMYRNGKEMCLIALIGRTLGMIECRVSQIRDDIESVVGSADDND